MIIYCLQKLRWNFILVICTWVICSPKQNLLVWWWCDVESFYILCFPDYLVFLDFKIVIVHEVEWKSLADFIGSNMHAFFGTLLATTLSFQSIVFYSPPFTVRVSDFKSVSSFLHLYIRLLMNAGWFSSFVTRLDFSFHTGSTRNVTILGI